MRKKLLTIVTVLLMCFVSVPTIMVHAQENTAVASADTTEITASQTLSGNVGAITVTGGTQDNPVILTVDGIVLVNGTITISSGYVTVSGNVNNGENTIKKAFGSDALFSLPHGANLTVENLTIDGGAVWTGEINTTLGRGTVNTGFSGGNMFAYEGNVTVKNCTIHNNDGGYMFSSNKEHNPQNVLTVSDSIIINNNGGISWSRDTVNFTDVKIAYNSGSPSVFRPCGKSNYTIENCDIHHNYGDEYGVIGKWASNSFTVKNSKFSYNTAKNGSVMYNGGAAAPYFYDCEFINNSASAAGGVFYITGGNGVRLKGNTVISGNSSPKGSAVYTDKWFVLENDAIGRITDNTGSAAIYMDDGNNTTLQILGECVFSGNTVGDIYVNKYKSIEIAKAVSDIYISWRTDGDDPVVMSITTSDAATAGKLYFNGINSVDSDITKLPFVAAEDQPIQFVNAKLNGGEVVTVDNLAVNTLPAPIKDHHKFIGWYTKDGTADNDWGELVSTIDSTETYYAKWEKSTYIEKPLADRTFVFETKTYGYTTLPNEKSLTFAYNGTVEQNEAATITSIDQSISFTTRFDKLTVTIVPNANLEAGTYRESIRVWMHDNSTHTIHVEFVVEPKEIEIEWTQAEFTYNGSLQDTSGIKATYKDINGNMVDLTVSLSGEFKNAGEYIFTASFANGETNYKLPNVATKSYEIAKANAEINVDITDIEIIYGNVLTLPNATTNFGQVKIDKTVDDMKNVGEYIVTYSVEGTENYNGDSKQLKVTVLLDPVIDSEIQKVQTNLNNAVQNLNTALNNKADKNALETAVNELTSAYKEADETLNKALQGQITANANEIADLKTKLTNAESTLEDAIKKVAADLEAAKNDLQAQIDTLTTSVGANATDIAALEKAISDLDTAYKAADAIMGGRLDALESADATIKESIQALKSNLTATDEALDRAIQALKAELDKAVADLEKSIADGDKGLQDKADALTAAYKAADEAINSEIVKLKAEDATIKQSVADLQAALTSARSELKGLIDKVQKNLDDAEAELREAIAQNKTDLSKEISDLKAAKAELEKLIADIKTELESKINDVKTALEKAENDLNNAIAQNRTDLTGEIEALRKAMEDADAFIKGNITELENADAAIIKDIAELEASLAGAKTELEVAIAKVQSNLDTAVDDLNNAIAQNKTDLSAEIKAVEAALKNADSIINGKIADLVDEDTAIKTSIEALGNSLAGVKADLETAIAKVQSNLDTAVDDLNNAIAQNKTDLSAEIKAVEAALKNADSVIDGKIADLIAEDTKINASISSLENSIANTKTELKGLIDTVSKNLETAKSELEAAIATGDTALDEKITALDKAYKAADTLIKGEIAELAADDEEISAGITELEASLAAVKSELEAAIAQVQKNLDNAKAELAAKDADLEAKYGELNSKITLLVVIISVVGAISVGGAVAIVIALAKKRI